MKKILYLLLIILSIFTLSACGNDNKITVKSISIIESTVPESVLIEEVDNAITNIKFEVLKSDNSKEEKNLEKSLIMDADLNKLSTAGTHELTVLYENVSTKFVLVIVEANDNYKVKVTYPDNTPVTSSVSVQWCTGNNCFLPVVVNNEGIAEIELEDGDYYIHLEGIPSGYTYNPNGYTTSKDNKFIEIQLIKLDEISEGDGTTATPFIVGEGCYTITFEEATAKGLKYFSFTPEVNGEYSIISLAMDKLALNAIDPYIGFLGFEMDLNNSDISGNIKDNINFNHKFTAEAGKTYYFIVFVSSADKFPASFDIIIQKN